MQKDKFSLIIITLLLIIFSSVDAAEEKNIPPSVQYGKHPNWVKPFQLESFIQSSKKQSHNQSSVRYLLSDQQINIAEKDTAYFTQVLMQPLNEQGLENTSELSFDFNPNFEKLIIHEINVIRNNKKTNRLNPKDVKVFKNETDLNKRQYTDEVRALIILKDIRVDDIIQYTYSRIGMNPVLGKKHFGRFSSQWNVPVEKVRLRLVSSPEIKLQFKSDVKHTKTSTKNQTEYHWSINNTLPVKEEDQYPTWYNPYSFIEFSEYKNWKEVNDWAFELYTNTQVSKKLLQQIKEWQKTYPKVEDQISVALRFVQDEIRYFGIEVGQNTHKPHTPEEVFERRYGDCKDKTTLLIAILNQLGVKSYPALVSSYIGKKLHEYLPSPGVFNHVIVYLKYNNKDYWLDGTFSHQRGGIDNIGFINYHQALIVKKNQKDLTQVKKPKRIKPKIITEETFDLKANTSDIILSVKTTYQGIKADTIRYRIATESNQSLSERYLNYYSQYFNNIKQLEEVTFEDSEKNNKLTTYEKYNIKDWPVKEAGKQYIEFYPTSLKEYLVTPSIVNRKHPFSIASNFNYLQQQIINLNDSKLLNYSNEKITKKTQYFNYEKTIKKDENTITINHHFEPLKSYVEANHTTQYLALIKKLKEDLSYQIITLDKRSSTVEAQEDRLRSLARKLIKK
ncbi:DUF3857 domain-containing transglutaminase family protein [Aliikangiella sp. IMCC44359]|uniref:DUF3857 domain-containing transglutaminase family protein n=1 Tax=Aliikangiella sp. IMCC44359 TaxID=3459125 RepID=UPI00403ACF0A